MTNAKHDDNREPTLMGVSDDGNSTPMPLLVDPVTGRLKVSAIVTGGVYASSDIHVLTTQAEGSLTNEINLGALSSGYIKSTVSGGVATISIGTAGDVYGPASSISDNIAVFNGTDGKTIKDGGSKITDLIPKTTLDAYSVLGANTDDTPIAVALTTNSVLGRIAGNLTPVTIDSDLATVSANDDTVPSAKATKTALNGKENLHGIQTIGAVTFDDSAHAVTIATGVTYWYLGTQKVNTGSTVCDIDDFETLTDNTTYFFYFDDTTGTLKCSDSFWNLKTQVPVCTVFWNGSAGALQYEYHNYTRDIDWHLWAHQTIGTRYQSGIDQTLPSTTTDNQIDFTSGTIHDEDIVFTTGAQTTCRVLYKTNPTTFTWVASSLPYAGSGAQPQYLDTDTYTLTNVDANKYVCMWVYASLDSSRPIWIIPTHATADYNTIALARLEAIPNLANLNLNPEMKLLYKWIYKGDGSYEERVDYRNSSSLPAGGSASTTAGSVSFNPSALITSTNVQAAIDELAASMGNVANPIIIEEVDSDTAYVVTTEILHVGTSNIQALNFKKRTGSVWFDFKLPSNFSSIKDIIFDMAFENSVADNNVYWQLEYWAMTNGGDTTPTTSPTATVNEAIACAAATETLKTATTTTLKIANTDFNAGDFIVCKLSRLGLNASDTNTGNVYLTSLIAYQA